MRVFKLDIDIPKTERKLVVAYDYNNGGLGADLK